MIHLNFEKINKKLNIPVKNTTVEPSMTVVDLPPTLVSKTAGSLLVEASKVAESIGRSPMLDDRTGISSRNEEERLMPDSGW